MTRMKASKADYLTTDFTDEHRYGNAANLMVGTDRPGRPCLGTLVDGYAP